MNQVAIATLIIMSSAFKHNDFIPGKYTCEGRNVNPPLSINNLPKETKSLVIIMDDPDAPVGTWVHWVAWNIPPVKIIKENTVPGIEGLNDFQLHTYRGPCPPSGTHRYFFKVYALNETLELPTTSRKRDVEKAMKEHIIAYGEIIGLSKKR